MLCKRAEQSSPTRRRANQMKLPLIIAVLIVYILLGSAAFLFFEHAHHEQQIRKWYFNHAINRFVEIYSFIYSFVFIEQYTLTYFIVSECSDRITYLRPIKPLHPLTFSGQGR